MATVCPQLSPGPSLKPHLMAAKKAKGLSLLTLEAAHGSSMKVWIGLVVLLAQAGSFSGGGRNNWLACWISPAEMPKPCRPTTTKGCLDPVLPQPDPLITRFYEIMQVYGLPLKVWIQEKFGDGNMKRHRLNPPM